MIKISASLLASDFARLGKKYDGWEKQDVTWSIST